MPCSEWELRVPRMVEPGVGPGLRFMTIITLAAKCPQVSVFAKMAIDAARCRDVEPVVEVTGRTADVAVTTQQGEIGIGVIEVG